MKTKLLTICMVALMVSSIVSAADVAGWDAFVIRNSTTDNIAPVISDPTGGKLFQILLGGQKAGWGTNSMNGKKVGHIQSLSIIRDSSVTGWGPYMNFWITDGQGGYAILANEPSHPWEWTGSSAYDTTWDVLKDATTWVYEVDSTKGFILPNGSTTFVSLPAGTIDPPTFSDFANYTIETPPSHWGGTGAPDVLNADPYTAYGFNWVFGDTQSNYLDGYLVSNPTLIIVTEVWVDAVNGSDSNLGTEAEPFATIQKGIDTVGDGGTVNVAAGTYDEGMIVIDKELTIVGDPLDKPVIKPTEDTGSGTWDIGSTGRGWYQITGGPVEFENLVFDGDGKAIYIAIQYHVGSSGGAVKNCDIKNIQYVQYRGRGIANYGGYVEVLDSTFTNIERIGVFTGELDAESLIKGCTYTGKGAGDWLDYAFEVGAGASATIKDNTITDCYGEDSGWDSAGIYVHEAFGPGTSATITGNTISGSNYGIVVGYGTHTTSEVVAHYNNIAGNDCGVQSIGLQVPQVDATYNWWGDVSGPTHSGNPGGTGDAVTDYVDYDPWLGGKPDIVVDQAGYGDYTTIQDAIDAATGTIIFVAPGTYDEQVVINKSLTLQGAGHTTVIQPSGPGILTSLYELGTQTGAYWNGQKHAGIILVDSVGTAGVTIKDLQVDGANVDTAPAGAECIVGIFYGESAGSIDSVRVIDVNTSSENPRSYSMFFDAVSTAVSVDVNNCTVTHYNRGGIYARGNEITVNIHDNFVTGPGTSGIQVPNGILLINGAGGTISSNIIYDDQYSGPGGWKSSGIALWEGADGILIEENTIYYLDLGIALTTNHGNATVQDNMVHDCETGVLLESGAFNNTITGNTMQNNTYGIRLNGALHPSGPPSTDPPGTGNVANNNRIVGNTSGVTSYDSTQVFDAKNNWWGSATGPSGVGPGSGDFVSDYVDYAPFLDADPGINILKLEVQDDPVYLQPGEIVVIDMDALDLAQHVTSCQAVLNFDSAYFNAEEGEVDVQPGGGIWNELMWGQWTTDGDLDVAVGVELTSAVGTKADGTVAKFTLTAKPNDGTTKMVFRTGTPGDEFDDTFFGDSLAQLVYPGSKINSQDIVIDGTTPVDVIISAVPASWTTENTVTLTFSATDALSGIDHYELSIDGGAYSTQTSPYALDVSSMSDDTHTATVKAIDKAGNEATASTDFYIDHTAPSIEVTAAVEDSTNVLDGANTTLQGIVTITVTASDATSGLASAPAVKVVQSSTELTLTTTDTVSPYNYNWAVNETVTNGTWDISATVNDNAGNSSSDTDNYLVVNKNQITGSVELESLVDTDRAVTFVATGGAQKEWTPTLSFSGSVASYTLTDVPDGTANLSAKAAWNLRVKITGLVLTDADGQEVVNFTGDDNKLRGGDLNGTNGINILDYSVLRMNWFTHEAVADINGDGNVNVLDFVLLKKNFFQKGDDL